MLFSRLSRSFCAPTSYLGCKIFLAEFITSDRDIASRTNGHRSAIAAGPCSVCQLTALGQRCSAVLPPFLVRLQFPSSLTRLLTGKTYLLSLPTSHNSLLLLVSLAPALPQPPVQGGLSSIPKMWCSKEFGGHLPLHSVSAEAKSQ